MNFPKWDSGEKEALMSIKGDNRRKRCTDYGLDKCCRLKIPEHQ
jgi:hypothetical protein